MIFWNKSNVRILRFIIRHKKGVSIGSVEKKFGERGNISLLINLCREDFVRFGDGGRFFNLDYGMTVSNDFLVFATPKAEELIEKRCFEFWRWVIPTLISVVALAMNIISLTLR